jgi:hypothetical protein
MMLAFRNPGNTRHSGSACHPYYADKVKPPEVANVSSSAGLSLFLGITGQLGGSLFQREF